jgi:Fe2+ or Zn2+ uptake regulation protein
MNATHKHPVLCCATEAQLREALEKSGWRFTRQRAAVYEYLCAAQRHPTAEDVYLAVQRQIPHISLATVYKALEALVDAGLVAKVVGENGPARYDCRREDHYHFRCVKSGKVHDLPTVFDPRLLDKLDPNLVAELRRLGFHVTNYRLEVLGYYEKHS